MSKTENRRIVPRLRFPEFLDSRSWKEQKLGTVLVFQVGFPFSSSFFSEDGKGVRLIRNRDLKSDDGVIYYSGEFDDQYLVKDGDFLVGMDGDFTPIIWRKGSALLNQRVGRVVVTRKAVSNFVYYSLMIRLKALESVTAKTTVKHLSHSDVENITELFPEPREQQKIADCLSSLDDLITLEAQKLNALKTHKKGLMQQLFPAEGETVPRLRFPEFRGAGEWEGKRLGDIGSVRMCKRILKEQTSPRGDIPFYKIGTFGGVPDAFISREIFESFRNSYPFPKNGAVLISAAGTIGRTVRYNGELAYFQDSNIVWLDNNEDLVADNFLFYLYQLINWAPSVGAIQRLYNENILGAKVKFPTIPEQQRIADCLASLDDLITAQTQQLTALKTHNKGLMQQLFPVMNGVDE